MRALQRLPDHLRVTGKLTSVLTHALRKQTVLTEHALDRPRPEDVGMSIEEVVESYLQDVRPSGLNESVAEHVRALQEICDDLPGLLRSALRHLCYQQLVAESGDSATIS